MRWQKSYGAAVSNRLLLASSASSNADESAKNVAPNSGVLTMCATGRPSAGLTPADRSNWIPGQLRPGQDNCGSLVSTGRLMVGKAMFISCDEHGPQVTVLDAGWFGTGRRVDAVLIGAADDLYR